jgi:hypothetical protein
MWTISPFSYVISIGKDAKDNTDFVSSVKTITYNWKASIQTVGNILPFGCASKENDKMIEKNTQDLSTLNIGLMLLNCHNIETEKILPSIQLNAKRIKNNKMPLFSYHTLIIKPIGKRQESIPKHLWENRIHLRRGHFKTYSSEKPLFGTIYGRFWWQPHVAGRNKMGIVLKDYEIRNEYTKETMGRVKEAING